MTEQTALPGVPGLPPPPAGGYVMLTELEIQNYRNKLVESEGNMEKAGITLDEMRNVLYTCRMKANPMKEQESAEKPEKKAKTVKEPSINRVKLSGDEVNDFLG